MKDLGEQGAQAVFPKFLKCFNCGAEALVESYADMARNLPGFSWLDSPPNPPASFQFGCPNSCGACYVSGCAECRQNFHYEQSILFGGSEPIHVKFGERVLTEIQHRPGQAKRYKFTHKRQPKRRRGDSDGTLQAP